MVFLIIGIILSVISIIIFYSACRLKTTKDKQQEQYKQQLKKQIDDLKQDRTKIINLSIQQKKSFDNDLLQWQEKRKEEINNYIQAEQKNADNSVQDIKTKTNESIIKLNKSFQLYAENINKTKLQLQNEINKLKSSLSAGVKARLRELQMEQNLKFYKLNPNQADLEDIEMLERLKISFHKPVVLSKLIWTQYFQKPMTELCDKILGTKTVTGIYKITNLITKQCYIGQSIDIAQRWKTHCKHGLGIDAPSSNKLYNSMQQYKVWNFTFELLEQCPRELLNEKEAFWINTYQSNKFGLNTVKGNLKT